MRTARTVRTLLTLVLSAFAAVLLATPAGAGGPTSVLLVAQGGGGTASLYYDDPDYPELSRLVGYGDPGAAQARGSHQTDRVITATWLIHDVQVWRVDRIYLGGTGGPWVATQTGLEGEIWDAPLTWHRPAEPAALLGLLDRLGLEVRSGSRAAATAPAEERQPPAQPVAATPAGPGTPVEAAGGTPWLLLVLAAAGGALLAGAGTQLLARRGSRGPGTGDPVAAGTDGEAGWSPVERLAHR